MQRILIADTSVAFLTAVTKQLKRDYIIKTCSDGEQALRLIESFDPDILVLDLQVPTVNGICVLHTLRATGRNTKVIAIASVTDAYICRQLEQLQVTHLFPRTCFLGALIACIRDITLQLTGSAIDDWCLENETERMLLELGLNMGPIRFRITYHAILFKYEDPEGSVTKCLYPKVAKMYGGTTTQVEKAIRDAIKDGWKNGSRAVWQMYFPPGRDEQTQCPSNEVFIARIAAALRQKTRLKKPYISAEENVM